MGHALRFDLAWRGVGMLETVPASEVTGIGDSEEEREASISWRVRRGFVRTGNGDGRGGCLRERGIPQDPVGEQAPHGIGDLRLMSVLGRH
jgi:hypothetical protein